MLERRLIAVEGVVQGVGFRPYVHRLAAANSLRGFVRNDAAGVLIDVEGDIAKVEQFCRLLTLAPPALATIARLRMEPAVPQAYDDFRIVPSDRALSEHGRATIPPDAATCDRCIAELFDPSNRRFRHPFITCTDCGPRYTLVTATPYDRERTTMADFAPCPACEREYRDPRDRRFHAESIACPDCGPVLVARSVSGFDDVRGERALEAAVTALRAGAIVAIKALGGFHLACDATSQIAVEKLRQRKQRPAKPFAVMVGNASAVEELCDLSAAERAAIESAARPVVLATRRADAATISPIVAPGCATLGVMLPSTPVHHLLLAALDRPLVMTSGNRGGDPVVTDDASAFTALGHIADLFLTHDRRISSRCDDSVVRVIAGETSQLRRARGYVPNAIALPFAAPASVLAFGGHLKNTVCLAHGLVAHLSAHVGDLDSAAARGAMRCAIDDTLKIARVRPSVLAHDLHPNYASTAVAEAFGDEHGIVHRVPVQHHHAHVAACLAEQKVREPVIGVVFDGAGLGDDGAIWGGEFLVVDGARYTRCGHLAYVSLPGGDAAARRPWRSAASHLAGMKYDTRQSAAFRPPAVAEDEWLLVQQLISRTDQPRTSSVGRLFDAVASLLGLCHVATFEGEAAMALEAAAGGRSVTPYPVSLTNGATWTADPSTIIEQVLTDRARGRDTAEIAAAFHRALRDLVVLGCERIRRDSGLETVVLSGGVFVNALLTEIATDALMARRFRVLLPRLAPCNDGGLSLGQAYVAACALEEDPCV